MVLLILGAFPAGSASSTAAAASTESLYEPARISFDELVRGRSEDYNRGENDVFWESLHRVGLLSITDIPDFDKPLMLKDLEDCLHRQDVGAPEFHLTPNTTNTNNHHGHNRRTLATRTLAGTPEGILAAMTNSKDEELPCEDLKVSSERFRTSVQMVSEAIAARFGAMESSVVLEGSTNTRISIENLINEGEHLEHFHSYYSTNTAETATKTTSTSTASTTIDWHTDQGMMLLFTPGQFQDGTTPNGFFIRLGDGSTAEVAFDSKIDDLVIMLGDGVNQYINPSGDAPFLRAVPHAVTLPSNNNSEFSPRLWYGRMVLPPPGAIHPSGNGITFEEHRTAMIQGDVDALSLGCASSTMVARELTQRMNRDHGPKQCEEESDLLCWMTCQSTADIIDSCTSVSENHTVFCANDSGELWDASIHSAAYKLRCFAEEEVSGISMDHDPFHHEHDGMDMGHGDMDGMGMEESSAAGIVPGLVVGMTMAMIAAMR